MSFTDKEIRDRIEFNNKLINKIQAKINLIKKQETEQCTIHDVVGQSEQLVCRICGSDEEMSKDYDLCYACWKEYHPDAN